MVNALIRWSLSNRLAVVILSGMLVLVGGYVTTTVPVDVFPDLTAPTVTILVEGRGMAPEEMETLVTFPIETAVNGAANVRRVRSATAVGIAVVWIEFEWGTDIYRARQTVTERLTAISGKLPEQVEAAARPISSIMGEILFVSLTSDQHNLLDLRPWPQRTYVDDCLRGRRVAGDGHRRRPKTVSGDSRRSGSERTESAPTRWRAADPRMRTCPPDFSCKADMRAY